MKIKKSKVFVPVTDEMLYEYPELIKTQLRPYRTDEPCFHWLAEIESAADGEEILCFHRTISADSKNYPSISRLA